MEEFNKEFDEVLIPKFTICYYILSLLFLFHEFITKNSNKNNINDNINNPKIKYDISYFFNWNISTTTLSLNKHKTLLIDKKKTSKMSRLTFSSQIDWTFKSLNIF